MKCLRHDPETICPECGLDRRTKMKTAREVIADLHRSDFAADSIIAALAANGFRVVEVTRWTSAHFIVYSNGDAVRM